MQISLHFLTQHKPEKHCNIALTLRFPPVSLYVSLTKKDFTLFGLTPHEVPLVVVISSGPLVVVSPYILPLSRLY